MNTVADMLSRWSEIDSAEATTIFSHVEAALFSCVEASRHVTLTDGIWKEIHKGHCGLDKSWQRARK